ncbi:MAG: hydroxymethylglutaryl-CoA reductase, degradative, partial [Pseudomonadales bacterium]|nr:hydroxymethylglutaryl-CoA reductase, degradative [Pseudomonadales bacterium]
MSLDSRLPMFRSMTPSARLGHLQEVLELSAEDVALLSDAGALALEVADGMIENVIGTFELPYAVASNFQINGRDVIVPMVVEEPSVVAAASFMAKLAREAGGFQTSSSLPLMRAQVQIVEVPDPYNARLSLMRRKDEIIELANRKDQLLNRLGGGCRDIEVHTFAQSPRGPMLVAHLIVDVRDAMGANTVNTMAEAVAPLMEEITGGKVRLRILSNLADLRLARAQIRVAPQLLTTASFKGEDVIEGILDAYNFAVVDPYRAATHNKGIMNGIDAVALATGNDWRAIEAG